MIRSALRQMSPLLAAAALGACATDHDKPAGSTAALTPTQQFPMKTRERDDEVRLAAHTGGLSQAQVDALTELAGRWLAGREPTVTIQEPVRGADPRAVDTTGFAARALLVSLGVPADRVNQAGYDPQGDGPAPVIVGFEAFEAVVPTCGRGFARINATMSNQTMQNFGCAVSANMAAQIADPADIASPRAVDASNAGRRAFVLDKYRQGQPTSTAADTQASGAISSSVGKSGG